MCIYNFLPFGVTLFKMATIINQFSVYTLTDFELKLGMVVAESHPHRILSTNRS